MRVVAFVPSKLNSERLPRKNVLPLNGIPLVNYVLRTLNNVEIIDDIVVFASESSITEYIEKDLKFTFMKRPAYLDTNEATVQDFIGEFLKQIKSEIVVLIHITSPFIKPETVSECIHNVIFGKYDSAFTALEIRGFAWYEERPLNYSFEKPYPRTQDLEPILFEQGGLYAFRREIFESSSRRIATNPFIKIVNKFEGHDIDTHDDFQMANLMIERKLV
ncbi:MAG: acylneuraminate cytidylyltransferase family protein [Candidatus Scalindua sp.]|nr:acylneuraminate cytidylyltransferase family protein [Candidatus Scalindua sp.]